MYQIRWMISASATPPAPLENATESRRPAPPLWGDDKGPADSLHLQIDCIWAGAGNIAGPPQQFPGHCRRCCR
jgi:hypothetical protein